MLNSECVESVLRPRRIDVSSMILYGHVGRITLEPIRFGFYGKQKQHIYTTFSAHSPVAIFVPNKTNTVRAYCQLNLTSAYHRQISCRNMFYDLTLKLTPSQYIRDSCTSPAYLIFLISLNVIAGRQYYQWAAWTNLAGNFMAQGSYFIWSSHVY